MEVYKLSQGFQESSKAEETCNWCNNFVCTKQREERGKEALKDNLVECSLCQKHCKNEVRLAKHMKRKHEDNLSEWNVHEKQGKVGYRKTVKKHANENCRKNHENKDNEDQIKEADTNILDVNDNIKDVNEAITNVIEDVQENRDNFEGTEDDTQLHKCKMCHLSFKKEKKFRKHEKVCDITKQRPAKEDQLTSSSGVFIFSEMFPMF